MSEWHEQREVVRWFRETHPDHSKSIRLSLNGINLGGGKKAAIMVNQMVAQGMVRDESDLFIAVPKGGYHGVFVEMKDAGKKLSDVTDGQINYLIYQRGMGYYTLICAGADEAIREIGKYMRGETA